MIDMRLKKIGGYNLKDLAYGAHLIVKEYAPLQHARWKDVPIDTKEQMWLAMKQKIDLQEEPQFKAALLHQLYNGFKRYRYHLHRCYLKNIDNGDMIHNPPPKVSQDAWERFLTSIE